MLLLRIYEYIEEPPHAEKIVDDKGTLYLKVPFMRLVMQLRCTLCGHTADEVLKGTCGTALTIEVKCRNGHLITKWISQPYLGKMAAGNLLCSAATLFSGETLPTGLSFLTWNT